MSRLWGAHAGYSYQDLLCAGRLVDQVLGPVVETTIDRKHVPADRFDDLTAVWADGLVERVQFKHNIDPAPLGLSTFTTDARDLLITDVIASALAFRDQVDPRKRNHLFRIVLRDQRPVEVGMAAALVPAELDPGPLLPQMSSLRYRFDVDVLWPEALSPRPPSDQAPVDPWAFLRSGTLSRSDLIWFIEHTVVEVEAPAASFNLAAPGAAENLVLRRATEDVGAGFYPNVQRTAIDVVGAFVGAAQAARGAGPQPTVEDLLRRAQIARDYGGVARGFVRSLSTEVARPTVAEQLVAAAKSSTGSGRPLVVTGAPGQGKSWASEVLAESLRAQGWLVGEHSCFLGASDLDRDNRVRAEVVFASLTASLIDADAELERDHRPRYASDDRALTTLVQKAVAAKPNRPIALIVDGLDHVSRVVGSQPGVRDASTSLAQELALLDVPSGAVLVVFSQPGQHLGPFKDAELRELVPWNRDEVADLAGRLGVLGHISALPHGDIEPVVSWDDAAQRNDLLDELTARCGGNPLYATYLCRELLRSPIARANARNALASFPVFDGTLEGYYSHLVGALGADETIAEVLAVLDFAVTRQELREIYPEMGHRVESAVDTLQPVLIELAGQGGLRIFHESLSRYLLTRLTADQAALEARVAQPIKWLRERGFFSDTRSFRFLLPMLARVGKDAEVVALVDVDFARHAIRAGFSATGIAANLATASESAARLGDWVALVRCVELTRAAYTFESERLDSTVADYADVPIALLGASTFAERLLFDGRTTMPSRAGLLLCLAVDRAGGTAPWREYLDAFERERAVDNTSYGEASDRAVMLASLHGQLRQASAIADEPGKPPLSDRVARWLDDTHLAPAEALATVVATLGAAAAVDIANSVASPNRGAFALAMMDLARSANPPGLVGDPASWAAVAVSAGSPPGSVSRLLDLGVETSNFPPINRDALADLTREQQTKASPDRDALARWLDEVELLAAVDPVGLNGVEGVIREPGWYACWLRFAVHLARLRADRRRDPTAGSVLDAIRLLGTDTDPFTGTPRACDLYSVEALIADNIAQALEIVVDADWEPALHVLLEVSDRTSTTLMGAPMGPLSHDVLLELVNRFNSPKRSAASRTVVIDKVRSRGRYRYYSDLAAYELSAARLALVDGDFDRAKEHWDRAATFLVGYGWRKDITIYDLLDAIPSLSALDARSGLERLARLQPLIERVVNHTDGSETRHAPSKWWELLTVGDPDAAGWTVLRKLTDDQHAPQPLLEGVRSDLWRAHEAQASPDVAAALRVTLGDPSLPTDAALLDRLRPSIATSSPASRLPEWIVARWDERSVGDGQADRLSSTTLDRGAQEMNRAGAALGAHPITSSRPPARASATPGGSWTPPLADTLAGEELIEFGPGALGIARGVREWRRKSYGVSGRRWDLDRIISGVGYRLLELEADGHHEEAESALHAVAEELRFGDESHVLASLAEGLEVQGIPNLAVVAHVLAFTRSRGGGGWLTFGDRKHVPSVERALDLDPERARQVLASEVGQVIRGPGYRTMGVSRALVQAFAMLSTRIDPVGSEPSAFSLWDAACEVIEARLPAADPGDAPRDVYLPADPAPTASPDAGVDRAAFFVRRPTSVGDAESLDGALVAACVAGLAHPGREQKRRTLLAIEVLLDSHPGLVMAALSRSIRCFDVSTTTWVLELVAAHGLSQSEAGTLQEALTELAASNYLAIRTKARQLLRTAGVDPGPTPAGVVARGLLDADQDGGNDQGGPIHAKRPKVRGGSHWAARSVVEEVCGRRLGRLTDELPGLRSEVERRAAGLLDSTEIRDLIAAQREQLVSQANRRVPDALTGDVEAAERALQVVAGGARTSLAMEGIVMSDPETWDGELADGLVDDAAFALGLEAARIARPALSPPPLNEEQGWSALEAVDADDDAESALRQYMAHPGSPADPTQVSVGPFAGWQVLALVERRETLTRWQGDAKTVSIRSAAFEIRSKGDGLSELVPPLGYGHGAVYRQAAPAIVSPLGVDLSYTQPLVGEDYGEGNRGSLVGTALGLPCPLLVPAPPVVVALGLRPSLSRHELSLYDDLGRALSIRTWRTGYGSSEYEMARPSTYGCDLVLRPDLFEMLRRMSGSIVWREHAVILSREARE